MILSDMIKNKEYKFFIYMKHFGPIGSWEAAHYTLNSCVGNFRDDTDVNLNFLGKQFEKHKTSKSLQQAVNAHYT